MRLVILLGVLAASLALVAAGCGGDDEPEASSTAEWAESFCTTVNDWTDELRGVGDEFDDPSSLNADAVEEAADDFEAATNDFLDELRELGAPETESGQAVEESLDELAETVEAERDDLRELVDDVSGLSDVAAAITAFGTSLAAVGTTLDETLDVIRSNDAGEELRTAFEDTDACEDLRN